MLEILLFTCLLAICVPLSVILTLFLIVSYQLRKQSKNKNPDSIKQMFQNLFEEAKTKQKESKSKKTKVNNKPDYEDVEYRDA